MVGAILLVFAIGAPALAQEAEQKRPAALVPLYVAHVALHGLDVHSTVTALERGHTEANPLLKNATSGQMIGVKVASSAASIWLAEKLWKKNRVAAVAVMAGVNAGLATIAANNYRIARSPSSR